jgi:hypothetical protein
MSALLGEMPELQGALNARLDWLSRDEFVAALDQMQRGRDVAQSNGRRITMTFGLDSLIANLCKR